MEFTINITDTTTLIALYGALVATAVLVWDIIKWIKTGPILKVSASPNMEYVANLADAGSSDDKFVFVEVTNVGDRPTTLTHLAFVHFKDQCKRWFTKEKTSNIIINPGINKLPYLLEPGGRWLGTIKQTEKLDDWISSEIVMIHVFASGKKKPATTKVRFKY